MMEKEQKDIKWICDRCDEVVLAKDILWKTNPFDEQEKISGCPRCQKPTNFERLIRNGQGVDDGCGGSEKLK